MPDHQMALQPVTRRIVQVAKPASAATSIARIHSSSWISWFCYVIGFALSLTPAEIHDLVGFHLGAWLLLSAVAAFFVAILAIQHSMRLSLKRSSFGNPEALSTEGVFHYSRNPMYVAFLIPLASLSYYSVVASGAAIGLYLLLMTVLVIRGEEAVLAAKFGKAYADYRRKVPRWVLV